MHSTASDKPMKALYDFSFAWESAYGRVIQLLQRLDIERNCVLDLGCGFASIADPVRDLGYAYVGADVDTEALKQLAARGFEAHQLDLGQLQTLAVSMQKLASGRKISAVLLLDVIEHLPQTRAFLSAIRAGLDLLGRPPLVVSVPNVSHVDVGAKLVFGRWDYMPTGLLDSTHIQFFTAERLERETRACGLIQLDANDFLLRDSDQHFPDDHPALCATSPVAQVIRAWRESADPHGQTIQFIRAYAPCDVAREQSETPSIALANKTLPLTVVMRTQGRRQANLREALTCLAAQSVDTFDVVLAVHADEAEPALTMVSDVVAEFNQTFASRVRVIHVAGGRRARPLNAALALLDSDYVAFLDDDDLVTADWIETFLDSAGNGVIVRSTGAVRHVAQPLERHKVPYLVESSLEFRYDTKFDLVHHFWGNETPICTFAVPRSLVQCGLRFDEQLPVLEDWDFLLRCVSLATVRDTGKVTSIYQMWRSGESSASLHDRGLWQATQRVVQDRSNSRPLVLPAGSAEGVIRKCERLAALEHVHSEVEDARREVNAHRVRTAELSDTLEETLVELDKVRRQYALTINSRRWRILGPLARAIGASRGVLNRVWSRDQTPPQDTEPTSGEE
jgi:SAM-dependent methyltransferase